VITLDTSAIVALCNDGDRQHEPALRAFSAEIGPALVPAGILGEMGHMIPRRVHPKALEEVMGSLEQGSLTLDCGDDDFGRILELMTRYRDLPLGFCDAAVVACAERNGGRVVTFDVRDFGVVAREGTITIVPEPTA